MPTDGYSFPYVAGWAGEAPDRAIRQTQARVADAAKQIIAASPAAHQTGGKVPGVDFAIEAARQRDRQTVAPAIQVAVASSDEVAAAPSTYDGPEVA